MSPILLHSQSSANVPGTDGQPAANHACTVAVVLNYRTAHETVRAVQSLQASLGPVSHIIVVDNASGDDSPVSLAANLPGVLLIETQANGGFSAGCNVGIGEALRLGAEIGRAHV